MSCTVYGGGAARDGETARIQGRNAARPPRPRRRAPAGRCCSTWLATPSSLPIWQVTIRLPSPMDVQRCGGRYWPGDFRGRSGWVIPNFNKPTTHHAQEGRHRAGSRHLETHYRDAWRNNPGRIGCGPGLDVFLHAPGHGGAATGASMTKVCPTTGPQARSARSRSLP